MPPLFSTPMAATKAATQMDVARKAGVSPATVSYVLSGRKNRRSTATQEVADRVRQAAIDLGYRPQRAGRVLRKRRTGLLAIAAQGVSPWAWEFIARARAISKQRGMQVVVLPIHDSDEVEIEHDLDLLVDGLADANIVLATPTFDQDTANHLAAAGVPLLVVRASLEPHGFDTLVQHEEVAVREAARYLVSTGSVRPLFIGEGRSERADAFNDELLRAGVTPYADDPAYLPSSNGEMDQSRAPINALHRQNSQQFRTQERALRLLSRPVGQRPDAIVVQSDRGAIAVRWVADQLGLSVPEQLRIIGCGNIAEGLSVNPPLTTLGSDPNDYDAAIERLLDRIEDPGIPTTTLRAPWRLIKRGTA